MKVLYLTPWYPSEQDAMVGLFVLKHAEAVRAQGADVRVICSQRWRDLWQQWRTLRRTWGRPDVVQVNVLTKNALLALWLRLVRGIPYIIVEHWSGYLPENGEYARMSRFKHALTKLLCRHAEAVMPVSARLEQAMQSHGLTAKRWLRARNVVDDFFYDDHAQERNAIKTLVHVSCFDEAAKNVHGLLKAFRVVCDRRDDVRLVIIGTGMDFGRSVRWAEELAFPADRLVFTGELTPEQVSDRLRRADAFVLQSRYETAAIVLIEAAAAGTPILTTPVGLAEEIVTPRTGVILPCDAAANHPQAFADAIEAVLRIPHSAEIRAELRQKAEPYTREAVGRSLYNLYSQLSGSASE